MIPGTLRTWTKSNSCNLLLEAKPLQTYWETTSCYLVKLNIHIRGPTTPFWEWYIEETCTGKQEQESLWERCSLWWERVIASPTEQYVTVKMDELQLHLTGTNLSVIILNENKLQKTVHSIFFNKEYEVRLNNIFD